MSAPATKAMAIRIWQTCERFGSSNVTDGKWSSEIRRYWDHQNHLAPATLFEFARVLITGAGAPEQVTRAKGEMTYFSLLPRGRLITCHTSQGVIVDLYLLDGAA
jgi:hypothetical protein